MIEIFNDDEFYYKELSVEQISKYVMVFQEMDNVEEKLKFNLFKNKFAIFNYIQVVDQLGYPKNKVFINDLMIGLQNPNWPFFSELLSFFKKAYPREMLMR